MDSFEVKGIRRMVVALVAVLTLGVVQVLAPGGNNMWSAIGLGIVTLGYFTSKFAEAASLTLRAWLESKSK
jgi:hypothetical protein